MKGTLYSADFIKTPDGSIKLLELNTDTTFVKSAIDNFDYSEFHSVLSNNNITEVHVIYKNYQEEIVSHLSASLHASASFITTFNKTEEHEATIYPTDITDTDTKFILRCAYNESAIFDSEYCKTNVNLYKLFYDNTGSNDIPSVYYSSSVDGVIINTIDAELNSDNIPDFAIKDTTVSDGVSLNFFKVGRPDLPIGTRITNFINENKTDDVVITNYYDTSENSNSMKSIRLANILYGNELENITIYEYQADALLEIPTSISWETGSITNPIERKHYFEFTTNYFKSNWKNLEGIHSGEFLQDNAGNRVQIPNAVVGEPYKSYRLEGAPDEMESRESWKSWSYSGSSLPTGSAVTSSRLIYMDSSSVEYGVLSEITLSNSASIMAGPALPLLVYDSDSDSIGYEELKTVIPGQHKLFNSSGSLVDFTSNDYVILENTDEFTYKLDFEDDDTFLINETGVKIISHNIGYCFAENTQIMMDDDTKKIQDIKVGDVVLSYDKSIDQFVQNKVIKIHESTLADYSEVCKDLGYEEVGFFGINHSDVRFTPSHPFLTKRGWAAISPVKDQEPFLSEQTEVLTLERGDEVMEDDGNWITIDEITFYPALESSKIYDFSVENTKTYIANGFIVHNKF